MTGTTTEGRAGAGAGRTAMIRVSDRPLAARRCAISDTARLVSFAACCLLLAPAAQRSVGRSSGWSVSTRSLLVPGLGDLSRLLGLLPTSAACVPLVNDALPT